MDHDARSSLHALVVLGCRTGPGVELPAAVGRRVAHAAAVATSLDVPLVVASGGRLWHGVPEAEAMRAGLITRGVPPERIRCELRSLTTVGNARHTAPLLRELGATRVGLVTCDWHMNRALRCFRAAGVEAEPFPAQSPPRSATYRCVRAARERGRWLMSRIWLAMRGHS
jgi:uncharacterized SAM-binding protein YcdF (DUF218 family)